MSAWPAANVQPFRMMMRTVSRAAEIIAPCLANVSSARLWNAFPWLRVACR